MIIEMKWKEDDDRYIQKRTYSMDKPLDGMWTYLHSLAKRIESLESKLEDHLNPEYHDIEEINKLGEQLEGK